MWVHMGLAQHDRCVPPPVSHHCTVMTLGAVSTVDYAQLGPTDGAEEVGVENVVG